MTPSPTDPSFVAHVAALRAAQGLPPVITDPATLAAVADLLVKGERSAA